MPSHLNVPITIPEYYKKYIDSAVDLSTTKNIACPFHHEQTGKSFTYSPDLGKWRCWGACHTGGDIIDLHKMNYHLHTRKEAYESLCNLIGHIELLTPTFQLEKPHVDETYVERNVLYNKAVRLATNPTSWIELDYILSKVPFDLEDLKNFIQKYDEVTV